MTANARSLAKKPIAGPHQENDAPDPTAANSNLGERLKRIRLQKGLTLQAVGDRASIARSTISKIENGQISPTFDLLQRLAAGLETDLAQLFSSELSTPPAGRRSVTRSGAGNILEAKEYTYEALATELRSKKMFPLKATIRAKSLEEFGGWVKHDGEEFLIVVRGEVCAYSEFYEPTVLGVGDSVYLDSRMGHAFVSIGDGDAEVVWVCSQLVLPEHGSSSLKGRGPISREPAAVDAKHARSRGRSRTGKL